MQENTSAAACRALEMLQEQVIAATVHVYEPQLECNMEQMLQNQVEPGPVADTAETLQPECDMRQVFLHAGL